MSSYDRKDAAYRAAKQAGYRSRAAVKLRELDGKFRLFRSGDTVVDLGCWPGGWLQVAAECVGERGRVIGVDLARTEPLPLANVETIVGDIGEPEVRGRLAELAGGGADVVLSDMSPKLSGVRATDDARQLALAELALAVAAELLRPGGRLVMKLFSTVEPEIARRLRDDFKTVKKLRPPSTRKGSSEIYAVASGRRGPL